jgi:hypothetical protein
VSCPHRGGHKAALCFDVMSSELYHTLQHSCCMQDKFRFYVFTMGDKPYAECMAHLLDPENRHFRSRIVNRADAVRSISGVHGLSGRLGQPQQLMVKTLQQVGISAHVAAILDDTSGAQHSLHHGSAHIVTPSIASSPSTCTVQRDAVSIIVQHLTLPC